MMYRQILFALLFSVALLMPNGVVLASSAQTAEVYDGSQLLRGRKGRVVYNIVGGEFDGKRGYLFRVANQSDVPVILNTIPDGFSEPVLGFLSNGSTLSDGTPSFAGRTLPSERLFDGVTETLNISPSTEPEDRPFNFIVVVEPTVDELIWFFRGREKRARISRSTVETLDLSGGVGEINTVLQLINDEGDFLPSESTRYSIDGVEVGPIPETGLIELSLDPGEHSLVAIVDNFAAGTLSFITPSSGVIEAEVRLKGEALTDVVEHEARLVSDSDGVVNPTTSDISLGFYRPDGSLIDLEGSAFVTVHRIEPGTFRDGYGTTIGAPVELTDEFTVSQNGLIEATNPQSVIAEIQALGSGPYMFSVAGFDAAAQLPLARSIEFDIARFSLNGSILRLPNSPAYDFADLVVELTSPGSEFAATASVNSSGMFDFGLLPAGEYKLETALQTGGEVIASFGFIELTGDLVVEMTPLTTAQSQAGEEIFVVASAVNLNVAQNSLRSARNSDHSELLQRALDGWPDRDLFVSGRQVDLGESQGTENPNSLATRQLVPGTNENRVSSSDGERVTESFTFTVPGTDESIGLAYQIAVFIGVQGRGGTSSWSLDVRDDVIGPLFNDGATFSATRLRPGVTQFGDFDWISGIEGEVINLAPSPNPAQDRTITVTVRANSSSINETFGQVTFSLVDVPFIVAEPPIEGELERVAVPRSNAVGVRRRDIDGDTVSLPDDTLRNTFDFRLPVTLKRVDTEAIINASDVVSANLELEYVDAFGVDPIVLFTDSTDQVTAAEDNPDEIEIQAAFVDPNPASTTDTSPPEATNVRYNIELTADVDGELLEASLTFDSLIGLYVTGDDVIAYINRPQDEGGDKWTHELLYNWLETNGNLLTLVNDISGEHGVDLRHETHRLGTDVDMRWFGDARGGQTVFNENQANVISAIRGDIAAREAVRAFIAAQHAGLEALENENVLSLIYGTIGPAINDQGGPNEEPVVLPRGWATELWERGTVTDTTGTVRLDINESMSTGLAALFQPWPGHDNHYHLAFDVNALN